MSYGILVQDFKMPNLVDKYKTIFWESKANLEKLPKLSSYIWVSYKFVLKSLNNLNGIFWATEYWLKTLKHQIWTMNTKPFFWESKANIETLQNFSLYIWGSYWFVLKSVKSLNRIWWATEYWFKALKCQIWLTNTKTTFLGKQGKPWNAPKTFSLYWSFLWSCFEAWQKA